MSRVDDMDDDEMKALAVDPQADPQDLLEISVWYPRLVLQNPALPLLQVMDPGTTTHVVYRCWEQIIAYEKERLRRLDMPSTSVFYRYVHWLYSFIEQACAAAGARPGTVSDELYELRQIEANGRWGNRLSASLSSLDDVVRQVTKAGRNLASESGQPFIGLGLERQALEELARVMEARVEWPDLPYRPNRKRGRR